MSALKSEITRYVAMRRGLGFGLAYDEPLLRGFARFLEARHARRVTTALALEWARLPITARPEQWARRLGIVRRFAVHLHALDPRTEVPPPGLLPYRPRRRSAHVYSEAEIARLLAAAPSLRSRSGLRAATCTTLIGLLVVTGLRISEAVALDDPDDLDFREGLLRIRRAKFGKSRLVPIHRSTVRALRRYARARDHAFPRRPTRALFVGEQGRRSSVWAIRRSFVELSRRTGLRAATAHRGPRLHDFRHRFAVMTLLYWYRRGLDIERHLPRLSTFLGHRHVSDTYWYLGAVPELLRLAAQRLTPFEGDRP
jgi:integrase/recombinase XerD